MKISKDTIWYGKKTFKITNTFESKAITKKAGDLYTCDRKEYLIRFDKLGEEFIEAPKPEAKEETPEEPAVMVETTKTDKMIEVKKSKNKKKLKK